MYKKKIIPFTILVFAEGHTTTQKLVKSQPVRIYLSDLYNKERRSTAGATTRSAL